MENKISSQGSCLCGTVTVQAKEMNAGVGACHCGMCRKWGGGPLLAVDCGIEVSFEGEDAISVFNSSDWAERGFCSKCGSHLFYRLKDSGQYIMPAGIFDNERDLYLQHQIFIDKKPGYYSFNEQTENMTEAEVFEMYGDDSDD